MEKLRKVCMNWISRKTSPVTAHCVLSAVVFLTSHIMYKPSGNVGILCNPVKSRSLTVSKAWDIGLTVSPIERSATQRQGCAKIRVAVNRQLIDPTHCQNMQSSNQLKPKDAARTWCSKLSQPIMGLPKCLGGEWHFPEWHFRTSLRNNRIFHLIQNGIQIFELSL